MRGAHAIAAASLMVAVSGCSAFNHAATDSPVPETSVTSMTPAPGLRSSSAAAVRVAMPISGS